MTPDTYAAQKRMNFLDLSTERLVAIGAVAIALLLALFQLVNGVKVRTVLVPPDITRTMWVEADQMSDEYLEDMTTFLNQLTLNSSAQSASYQGRVLRKYACADGLGALDSAMHTSEEKLKRDNATTLFAQKQLRIDKANLRVASSGDIAIFVGDRKVGTEAKTYVTAFRINAGKLCIRDFYEADSNDPFGLKPVLPAPTGRTGTPAK